MKTLKINHAAVAVSVVLLFVLGFLWYGPLFGEKWMGYVGLDMATIEQNQPGAGIWISNVISSIAPVYLLAWFFTRMQVESAVSGAFLGFLAGFIFFLLPTMTNGLFAQAPYGLAWIVGGFQTAGWTLAGIVLGAWKKYRE